MAINIKQLSEKSDFKKFVNFPFDLYKNDPNWVPPLKDDELKAIDSKHNPAFNYNKAQFWIAERDGKVVGRVGAIVSATSNEKNYESLCRFTRLEFIDDKEVSKALIDTVVNYARAANMDGIHGPLGFTNLDHQGMLIEGFDKLPSIASEYHKAYYKEHMDALGFDKEMDWVEFRIKIGKEIPEKAARLNEMIKKRYNLNVVHFNSTKELKPYGYKAFQLLNVAFADLFSFVKMPDDLLEFYINKYIEVLNPKFVKMIEDKDGNLIGFIISLPSLSEAMQKAKGSLMPFGWTHIMKALKKPKVVDLLLTAVDPAWQAQGVTALLITELQKVMISHDVEDVETTGMIETNDKAINFWKNYDHEQHKRKRCFIKSIK